MTLLAPKNFVPITLSDRYFILLMRRHRGHNKFIHDDEIIFRTDDIAYFHDSLFKFQINKQKFMKQITIKLLIRH